MSPRKAGLGKGLDSLIPSLSKSEAQDTTPETKVTTKAIKDNESIDKEKSETIIRISKICPNKDQPRKEFDEKTLTELAESIKEHGIIQPIIVTKKDDLYQIIAGERRWRAAKLAGLTEVPVIIRDYAPMQAMEIAIIENIQRKDLNPIEEANAYKSLIDEYNLTQEDVAGRLSKSRAVITNSLRLLNLNEKVRQMLISGDISAGHGRALAGVKDEQKQLKLAEQIVEKNLTVRQLEVLLSSKSTEDNKRVSFKIPNRTEEYNDDYIYQDMVSKLEKRLGTKVTVKRQNKQRGQLIIEYYSPDEFEQLFKHINR